MTTTNAAGRAIPSSGRPQPRDLVAYAVGAVLVAAAFTLLAFSGSTIDSLVKEDGVVEWIGSIGLFAGAGMFLAAFLIARRYGEASGKSRLGTWVLLAFAAGFFFLGGEEISWGQRLFGWGTPETLSEVNAQDETTFHNLQPFQGTTLDGDRLFRIAWFAVFIVLPLVAWLVPRWREQLKRVLPVAPVWIAALFLTAYVFTQIATSVFDSDWTSIYTIETAATEIQESVVELLMAAVAFMTLQGVRARR